MKRIKRSGSYTFTEHAIARLCERGLSARKILEDLPTARRHPIDGMKGFRCLLGNLTIIIDRNNKVITAYETASLPACALSRRVLSRGRARW